MKKVQQEDSFRKVTGNCKKIYHIYKLEKESGKINRKFEYKYECVYIVMLQINKINECHFSYQPQFNTSCLCWCSQTFLAALSLVTYYNLKLSHSLVILMSFFLILDKVFQRQLVNFISSLTVSLVTTWYQHQNIHTFSTFSTFHCNYWWF